LGAAITREFPVSYFRDALWCFIFSFNNVVYLNRSLCFDEAAAQKGDQRVLFYSVTYLDRSETSMLVSARFDKSPPCKHLIEKDFKAIL